MQIVDAYWTQIVNMLVIVCDCGYRFDHRADRWRLRCPRCGALDRLDKLRDRYVNVDG
jgi:acetone carboxylase gamma subunit